MIQRAGIDPWPKTFHALRASHETDLLERFPIQVVAKWLGHSPKIALTHYARTTDDHFQAAVMPQEATQNPTHAAHVTHGNSPSEGESYAPRHPEPSAAKTKPGKGLRKETRDDDRVATPRKTDGEGFEPPEDFRPQQFSRLPP